MTTEINKTLSSAETIFQSLIWDPAVQSGLAAFFLAVPWAAIWPIQPLIRAIVGLLSGYIFSATTLFVDVSAVKLLNATHQASYDDASLRLKILAHDKGIDSDDFKKALETARVTQSIFTRFNG